MADAPYKSFVKENSIVIAGHIIIYLKGIILMPIIIKTVGITTYGGFVLLTSILGIVFGVSSFGADFRAKRFLPTVEKMSDRRNLFYPQFFFGLFSIVLFSALLLILNEQINTYLFKNEIDYSPLIIPAYLIFYFLYSQGSDYFRYTSRIHFMTAATTSFPYIHIALILLLFYIYHFLSINVLVLSQAFAAFLIVIPCFWIIFRELGINFRFYNTKGLFSDIKLGFPLVIGFIIDYILAASDRLLIGFFLTVKDVGLYSPAYALGSLIVFIPKAMGSTLPQLLSKAVDKKNEHEAHRMLNYAIKIFLLLTIPFIFGTIALGKSMLILLANPEVSENANWITPIVAVGTLFYGLNIILSNVLFVRMKTFISFKMNLFAALFNLLGNIILLYFFKSILVAAITTLLSYFFVFLYINYIIRREKWFVKYNYVVILKAVIASIIMLAFLVLVININKVDTSIIMLISLIALGSILYMVCLFALGTFTREEMQFIRYCFISKK